MKYKLLSTTYYARVQSVTSAIGSGKNLLNVGCGDGYYNLALHKKFKKLVGVDIDPEVIQVANKFKKAYQLSNVQYKQVNAEKLPLPKESFDHIICTDVIEHVDHPVKLLREIHRVMENDGVFIITLPNARYPFLYDPLNYGLRPFGKKIPIGIWCSGHKRLLTDKEMKKLLESNGFEIVEIQYLTHHLAAFIENYWSDIFRAMFQKNPKMEDKVNKNSFFSKIVDGLDPLLKFTYKVDEIIFKHSKTSVGLFFLCRKK